MKSLYILIIIVFAGTAAFPQRHDRPELRDSMVKFQFTMSIGNVQMSGLSSDMDRLIGWGLKLDVNYKIRLARRHALLTGIGIESNSFIVDGVFSRNNLGQNVFGRTPDNYKQHELTMEFVQVPLLYCYDWTGYNTGSVQFGPYFSYLTAARSEYKISTSKFREIVPVENMANWGARFEIDGSFGKKTMGVLRGVYAIGLQYQFSNYLENSNSYKPLFAYFKVGIGITSWPKRRQ